MNNVVSVNFKLIIISDKNYFIDSFKQKGALFRCCIVFVNKSFINVFTAVA